MLKRGQPPSRPVVSIFVGLAVLSMVAGWLGDLLLAEIVASNPLLLVALSPRNRNLALATNELSAVSYYTVGFLRLIAADPVNYLLGLWFGERAISWIERRSRTYGEFVRDGEGWFRRASSVLIFLSPNNIICMLAGATGVRVRTFVVLNVSGTIARLIAIRYLGARFESPISSTVDFIGRYRTPILILSALAVAWTIFGEFRGDNSELQALRDLASGETDDEAENDAGDARHDT